MAKNNFIGIRVDDNLNKQIEAYASANHLTKVESVREMLSSKANDLSTELLQIKTSTNITSVESTETRKHVSKLSDILSNTLPRIDKNFEDITSHILQIEKQNQIICNLVVQLSKSNSKG
jgi:hypothetical protein